MTIWPEASSAQNNIAAVSAEGRTVCVLIRRLNFSCNRSMLGEGGQVIGESLAIDGGWIEVFADLCHVLGMLSVV